MLVATASSGCLSYHRTRIDEPLPDAALAELVDGRTTLGQCLQVLGAPTAVLEYRGDGMALVWSWQDEDQWGLEVSLPVSDQANVNFNLDLGAADRPGAVLWFGQDLVLERWRRGRLGELIPRRVRPASPEESGG
ncbi:MAG: hypothetical protein H6838_09140 [Planctomycetes bacterium]|nr:hypothetical protein [Planctomycetota bacterium]MCB9885644.1 hypothetical protein [Planctomycetota bacterium]